MNNMNNYECSFRNMICLSYFVPKMPPYCFCPAKGQHYKQSARKLLFMPNNIKKRGNLKGLKTSPKKWPLPPTSNYTKI